MDELLEAIKRDNLVALKNILELNKVDIHGDVIIGEEYDLDEYDEIPLLHYAIQSDASMDAIEMLLSHGIDISEVNRDGLGALDIAIKHKRMDVVKLCQSHGIDLAISRRKSGITPLMLACSFGDIEITSFLIAQEVDIDAVDRYGMSATAYAKRMGQKRILELLEKYTTSSS